MKIAIMVDKENSAIHRLAMYTQRALPHHKFWIEAYHPKRPSSDQVNRWGEATQTAHLLDYRYWKSAEAARAIHDPELPKILTHYNPYDLKQKDWHEYDMNIVVNQYQSIVLRGLAQLVPLPVDLEFFKYQQWEGKAKGVFMVVNRIEGKKGVLPVARAAKRAGLKMILVGRPSDPNYLKECIAQGAIYQEGISDELLRDMYHEPWIHVCNSVDNYETGTLPILEAMACGMPVLSRVVGHVPDMADGTNIHLLKCDPNDEDYLTQAFTEVKDDVEYLKTLSRNGIKTIRDRNIDRYGWVIDQKYHQIMEHATGKPLVSVIMPTASGPEIATEQITAILSNYPHLELIVIYDGKSSDEAKSWLRVIKELRDTQQTIKFFVSTRFDRNDIKDYGLQRARNIGIREAQGNWLMFMDDRMRVEKGTVDAFMSRATAGVWQWGVKDEVIKGFVENLSFIDRDSIIKIGGFSSFITQYGGITQETRKRAERCGLRFEMNQEAKATTVRSSRRAGREQAIAKSKTQCYKLNLA